MEVFVNGAPRVVAEGSTITALLADLVVQSNQVAVEVNFVLVPRARHNEHVLQAGDRLEVVTLVGGG